MDVPAKVEGGLLFTSGFVFGLLKKQPELHLHPFSFSGGQVEHTHRQQQQQQQKQSLLLKTACCPCSSLYATRHASAPQNVDLRFATLGVSSAHVRCYLQYGLVFCSPPPILSCIPALSSRGYDDEKKTMGLRGVQTLTCLGTPMRCGQTGCSCSTWARSQWTGNLLRCVRSRRS